MDGWEQTTVGGGGAFMIGKGGTRIPAPEKAAVWNRTTGTTVVLPFQVGDRLWVRETIRAKELSSGQAGSEDLADGEIGSASWRERRCQYGSITGVAVPLKKKNH